MPTLKGHYFPEMTPLEVVHNRITEALVKLESYFEPGCRLTFIMRDPKNDEADIVETFDDLDELKKVIERTQERASGKRKQ